METKPSVSFTYKDLFSREYRASLVLTLVMLGVSYVAVHFAYLYALEYSLRPTSTYVGDLLLDNLPSINLNYLIVEGALFAIFASVLFVLFRPRYILFSFKALALFIAVRALLMSLTHVGIYPGAVPPGIGFFDNIYSYLNLQSGFFFSGHTGLPFLAALIFWESRVARIMLLSLSGIFAVTVLLSHIHYSIDVFAAPFMAYGIFEITRFLFPRDYELTVRQSQGKNQP